MWILYALVIAGAVAALALLAWRRRHAPTAPPYPIVLVHGFLGWGEIELFGRRHRYFRGVGEAMEEVGAPVHVVTLPPAASVEERAAALARAVHALEAPRVHLVAHSMGGVDARYAIAHLGLAERVASLVTIGSPHHGTPLARLGNLPPVAGLRRAIARAGISSDASEWLTPERMALFNADVPDHPRVYYASVVGRTPTEGANPLLRAGRRLMARRAGSSDGIVPVQSQRWGEVIAELDADHWAQIGWSRAFDARPIYREIARRLRAREGTHRMPRWTRTTANAPASPASPPRSTPSPPPSKRSPTPSRAPTG